MRANSLPWCDFENLPFIIVYRNDVPEQYQVEAKFNLENIVKAKHLMSEKVSYQGQERSQNLIVDEGFAVFTDENFRKLRDQLNEHNIPKGIKRAVITEEDEKITEPISKQLLIMWLK